MTTWGILYLVILNRADFSTQVLSVVLPHIPAGPKSKVKSHTEPCRLVFIPFGRISTFFGYLRFMLYVSISGLFAPDSLLTDCYSHRLEVQLWVVHGNASLSIIKSKYSWSKHPTHQHSKDSKNVNSGLSCWRRYITDGYLKQGETIIPQILWLLIILNEQHMKG